jgi:hypothetical protein
MLSVAKIKTRSVGNRWKKCMKHWSNSNRGSEVFRENVSQCQFWSPQITKRLGLTGYQLSQNEPLPRTYSFISRHAVNKHPTHAITPNSNCAGPPKDGRVTPETCRDWLLINKLRKVYQVGVDSLMYHDARTTKHQVSKFIWNHMGFCVTTWIRGPLFAIVSDGTVVKALCTICNKTAL